MNGLRETLAEPGDLTAAHFAGAWRAAAHKTTPYRHWLLNGALPTVAARKIAALPIEAPVIDDT